MFNSAFFKGNRDQLRRFLAGDNLAVITAAGQLQRGNDSAFPFHQDANFWYLTGINDPEIILVIDRDSDYLICPQTSDYQAIFDGITKESELSSISGIKTILPNSAGWQKLKPQIQKSRHIATMLAPEPYLETYGIYINPTRAQLINQLLSINPSLELLDLRMQLTRMRMVKQQPEIKAIQTAIDLLIEALDKVKNKLPKMAYEYEVEAEIISHILSHGADSAWKPIVAAGKNATQIHYLANRSALLASDFLLIDVGAEVSHYVADISRTYSLGKAPTIRQKQIHEAVKKVQDFAFSLLKPGVIIRQYEKTVESFMGQILKELNIIKTSNSKQIRKYYPHATSHFLGLEPHDAGDYNLPLEPGVILTVEPGIYIPEESLGVRIEDDVLITKDGIKILSGRLSRSLA